MFTTLLVAIAALVVTKTSATSLTGGTSTLNTLVAGETPTSNALTLGITTELAAFNTITCTYNKAIFAADAAVAVYATPFSGAHYAMSAGNVLTITVCCAGQAI